ncbi:potassium transporter Kef [Agromyces sp. MMS24-JH15]|uniref:potassium transporter Kef n=1 Tax=Agromyces sp. MMS24-JH15 TaxID=3243765 RepID=UPI003748C123
MITRPRVVPDESYPPLLAPDPAAQARAFDALAAAGLDPALATGNVVRRGGRERTFRAALGAGVAARPTPGAPDDGAPAWSREALLDLASVAGWRAGVVALREDALARCEAGRWDAEWAVVAAGVLGVEASDLDEFLDRQATDRFWWPGRAAVDGFVWSAGGFEGFGDAWIAPPAQWHPLDEPGAFAVLAGGEWWRIDGDVWGCRLARAEAADTGAADGVPGVTLVLRPDTHVAWLRATGLA